MPIPDLGRKDLHALLEHKIPDTSESLRTQGVELFEQWREFTRKTESAKKYLTFRSLLRLCRLLHAGFEESEAVELALVNALLPLDKQLADAARLKLEMSRPAANMDDYPSVDSSAEK
jgi:hypothetical protein